MKKLLFAAIAVVTLGIAIPANAQVFVGADPGGAGVRVGPFGVGIGPVPTLLSRLCLCAHVSVSAHAHHDPKRPRNMAHA